MTSDALSPSLRDAIDRHLAAWDEPKSTNVEARFVAEDFPWATASDAYVFAQKIRQQRQRRTPIGAADARLQDPEVAEFIWAKSLLIATDAATQDSVSEFQDEVLNDRLLALGQVEDWINEQAKSDGPPTKYVTGIPIANAAPTESLPAHLEVRATGFFVEYVEFAGGDGWVQRRTVAHGGVLDRLRSLALQLSANYPWQPAQASTFVLTGATPFVTALTMTIPELVVTDRRLITLEIDPDVPVTTVADAYTKARQELLGTRARRTTASGTDLVIHCAERPGYSMKRMWTEWNDMHPERAYRDQRAFRQAWKAARRRTLGTTPKQRKPTGVRGRAALRLSSNSAQSGDTDPPPPAAQASRTPVEGSGHQ